MKAVFPLALAASLMAGSAFAADYPMGSGSQQSGMSSSRHGAIAQRWSSNQVRDIQNKLQQQGYDVGSVDGRLGPTTQQALRQFQQDKGIQASGQPDPQTLAALDVGGNGIQQGQLPNNDPAQEGGQQSGAQGNLPGASGGGGGTGGGTPSQQDIPDQASGPSRTGQPR